MILLVSSGGYLTIPDDLGRTSVLTKVPHQISPLILEGGAEPGLNLSEPPAGTTECRPLHQWICEAVLRITVIS